MKSSKNNKNNKNNILNTKNKTKKNTKIQKIKPSLKYLDTSFSLYASKQYTGDELLEYQRKSENKTHNHCLLDNSSWFGSLAVAKSYKSKDTHIYKWDIKKPTYLLKINKENDHFIKYIFKSTLIKLTPTIILTDNQIKKIKYDHPYINMTSNEKALYEFQFAFGYITVEEQYEFMKLVKYLIENKIITLTTREGTSIIDKIDFKINFYKVSSLIPKKQKMNRLSFYYFDKYAIMNLCKIVYNKKDYKISGVYQKNNSSFWFPNLLIYKMNIEEYILFNPPHNLKYDKMIE
uniref:Uncharacterized protein n=1 Tax=viral metagenome TaxID=1070528 RepID=A0A6C0ERN5_9ZZZZ